MMCYTCSIDLQNTTIYPKLQKVPIGGVVIFNCFHKGPVWWYFNDTMIDPGILMNNRHLIILENIQLHNGGNYTCIGLDNKKKDPFWIASELKVIGDKKYIPYI